MANLLDTTAPLSSEISMIIQLVSLVIIIVGFVIVKQKKYRIHGIVMFSATLMNTAAVLIVMIPVAIRLSGTSIPGLNLTFRLHFLIGLIVELIAVYILVDWRFQKPGPTCFQRKKWMLGLSLTWIAEVILGILVFTKLYQ
jgi:uncharacterized membrane protein YozB (DUF420 family)